MLVTKETLIAASKRGLISEEQCDQLWDFLAQSGHETPNHEKPRFSLGHVLYYLGGLIVIGAMSWFMVSAWELLGGLGIAVLSALFAGAFFIVGKNLWSQAEYKIPGGILVTAAVSVTPLIVYGLQKALGYWPAGAAPSAYGTYHTFIHGNWVLMELITVLVGFAVIQKIRFPFISFPIVFALWYLSMDLVPWVLGTEYANWSARQNISMVFGAIMLMVTYFIDRRTKEDFAFWGYLFGALIFWGALSSMRSDSELNKFIYCLINLSLVFLSVFLSRRIFIILGSMGVSFYIAHLAHKVFKDSLIFPLVLAFLGIVVIYIGIVYQKNKSRINNWILGNLPASVRALRPTERP